MGEPLKLNTILRTAVGAGLILPALALIAFGPDTSREVPPDRVVVTYWEKWTDFEGTAMRRLCDVFNDTAGAELGIYVDYVLTTQIDLKSLVAACGGDPPDLNGLWTFNVSSYAAKGALQPLDERAAEAGITPEVILPVYYNQGVYHDQLYSVPLTPWSIALYYNKDIFAEFADELAAAGYSADRAPRTMDEFADYCRIVHRRNDKNDIELHGFVLGVPENIGWYWYAWGTWFGATWSDPETGLMKIDSAEQIRAYEWLQEFVRMFGQRDMIRLESSLANFNSPDNPFMTGRLAMMQQGPWFPNMIRQYAPEINYGAAPFPTHDGSEISYCGQDVLVIPSGARHPDEAWAFIDWLYNSPPINVPSGAAEPQFGYEYCIIETNEGPQQRPMPPLRPLEWLCWNHYKNSPYIEPADDFTRTHPNPVVEVHDQLARSPLAMTEPPIPNWMELRGEFEATYRDIWAGRAEAAPCLRAAQKRIDALTKLAADRMARYGEEYP